MMQELTQEMKNLMQDTIRDVHTVIPGKIVTFDPDECEAAVLPFGKFKKPDGTLMDYPKIPSVPILFPQSAGQTATIAYPVKPEDYCLILVSEQALDTWRTGVASNTDLRFDLTNAVAIVGLFVKASPLVKEACTDNALIVEKDGERIRLKKGETYIRDTAGQSITMTPAAITVQANNAIVNSNGNASITASGSVTVKGSTVNIN